MTDAPLTRADIAGRKMTGAIHVDYSRTYSAWMGEVEGVPRLGVAKVLDRGASFTRWYVDGKPAPDLEAAVSYLRQLGPIGGKRFGLFYTSRGSMR